MNQLFKLSVGTVQKLMNLQPSAATESVKTRHAIIQEIAMNVILLFSNLAIAKTP